MKQVRQSLRKVTLGKLSPKKPVITPLQMCYWNIALIAPAMCSMMIKPTIAKIARALFILNVVQPTNPLAPTKKMCLVDACVWTVLIQQVFSFAIPVA